MGAHCEHSIEQQHAPLDRARWTGIVIHHSGSPSGSPTTISRQQYEYARERITGAGLACIASYLISYLPFVILEATWTLVSVIALIQYVRKYSR